MITIQVVTEKKEAYLPLLLEADPSEEMIARYLKDGTLFVMSGKEGPVCVAVISEREDGQCELKNLAVRPQARGQGYGAAMARHLFGRCRENYTQMYVGTSPQTVSFYERLGFQRAYVAEAFFTKNYPAPIYESGTLCTDMIYLKKDLTERRNCCG